ncbi:MAG: carcinine hydrolase/isopenicillin-N N-acyltransferase family protein [bacterium]
MNKTKNMLSVLFLIYFTFTYASFACTTAVISGKCTNDGRPILLKNRDTDELENKLVYFIDGKYQYIGLVNSNDVEGLDVWAGFNNAGFAIMNSASYNLKMNDTSNAEGLEGELMKKALMNCTTVDDFENLLKELPKPLGVESNYGVIDALGNAAYFETNNFIYTKYDINDPATAPNGYLIRTNFSFSGEKDMGAGYVRFDTASDIFEDAYKSGTISVDFILKNIPRCLKQSLTKTDLTQNLPDSNQHDKFCSIRDFIPRYSTSSAIVIQGIKPDEQPALTAMWTIMGFPLASVAIPVWLNNDCVLPNILAGDDDGVAPLCKLSLQLKKNIFSVRTGNSEDYIDLSAVINKAGTGILQKLMPLEDEIISRAKILQQEWRIKGIDFFGMKNFYDWVDEKIKSEFEELLH